jgi:uncharacterized membrane protein YraQ (UPF0718 family)
VNPSRGRMAWIVLAACFGGFVLFSFLTGFGAGERLGRTFGATLLTMLKLLPCAFVLIGLFDVWVKRETVEKHLGTGSGFGGYLWSLLLAGTTVGGMYLAFPVAYSLHQKGAKLGVIFAYVGFAGVCRIPMSVFEASFMGTTFTVVRLGVAIPLVLLSSAAMGGILERYDYRITE